MSANNDQNIFARVTTGLKNLFSVLSGKMERDQAARWEDDIRSGKEPRLFVVLKNDIPDKNSNDWERENVVTNLYALEARESANGIVAHNCETHLRALCKFTRAEDVSVFTGIKAGQWIECAGKNGGPLGEYFFTNSIKIRDDLTPVEPENLPDSEEVQGVLMEALFGPAEPQTLTFRM